MAGIVACAALGSWGLTEAAPTIGNAVGNDLLAAGVARVVDTDNHSRCDPNDPLVKKYRENLVIINGLSATRKNPHGAGLLTGDCSLIITAAHVLYDDSKDDTYIRFRKFSNFRSDGSVVGVPDNVVIKEGDWRRQSRSFDTSGWRNEAASLKVQADTRHCPWVKMIGEVNPAKLKKLAESGFSFHILKFDLTNNIPCVQICELSFPDDGAIRHNCSTEGGDSGSPIFVKTPDGEYYLIGVHVGGNRDLMINELAPIDAARLGALSDTQAVQ